jgi:hypothetical protein
MKNNIISVASAIAAELQDYGAEVTFAPEYDLQDLGKKRVCAVVPVTTDYEKISRSQTKLKYRVEIGLMYRAKVLDMSELLSEADTIINKFLHQRISGAICMKAEHVPMYDAENLRERNQFTSVVGLTLEEVQ